MRAVMRARSTAAVVVATLSLPLGCAAVRQTGPDATRTRPERRSSAQDFLDRTLRDAVSRYGFPGAAAAVITSRSILLTATGLHRIDRPERVTVENRFGLGSNTKAITATMLGALVERGRLRWDLPLAAALPDVAMRDEYRPVTLRQLLAHRAGLKPWTAPEAFARAQGLFHGDLPAARLELSRIALTEPPIYPPGTDSRYSNADYVIAALIAERTGERSWQDLVLDYVFRPLHMTPRFAGVSLEPDQPWGHSRDSGTLVPIEPAATGAPVMQGAGGVALSIADYSRFIQAHLRGLRGEDTVLLRAATVRELHRAEDGPYALGWHRQEYAGAESSIHTGGNGQFYAAVVIQPERDLAVVFLTNDGGDDVEDQGSALLKQLIAGPPRGWDPERSPATP